MHAREDFSNVLIEDTPVPLVAEPVSRTAYQLGYAAKVGDVNPFKIGCQRGHEERATTTDWMLLRQVDTTCK
jgi:hypothetical protein